MKSPRRAGGYGTRGARGKKHADERRLAFWLLGGCGVIVVSIIAAAVLIKPPNINPLTGCPKGNGTPKAHTIILIDETDRLPGNDLKFVKDLIMTEYRWLPLMGRLTVRNIVADPASGQDITICRVAESSSSGGLVDNDRAIRERFDKIAGARLETLFSDLATAQVQEASPVMETMADALYRTDFAANVPQRRLVVLSDFAQNSELFSMYSGGWKRSKILPESARQELERDLGGVDVRLQYMRRRSLTGMQGADHRQFWKRYVESQNAKSLAIGHGLLIGEESDRETWIYAPRETPGPTRQ